MTAANTPRPRRLAGHRPSALSSTGRPRKIADSRRVEWVVVGGLVVAALVLGVLPQVLLSVTSDAVTALVGGS